MTEPGTRLVTLIAVNGPTLIRLVQAATNGAAANEVTPPLTPQDVWSAARIAWLEDFHRTRADGLKAPLGEATWAVLAVDRIVGSVRLKHTAEPGILETGIWLVRGVRGRGVGRVALSAVLRLAAELGARGVRADTTIGNLAALGLFRRLGFDLAFSENGDGVQARLLLEVD